MAIPATLLGLPGWVVIFAAAGVVGLARDRWLERRARDVVERWASQHRYRLVRCRRHWFTFGPTNVAYGYGTRDIGRRRHHYVFGVEVEDRALGGRSRGRVSVRGHWLGGLDEDVDVAWDALNVLDESAAPAGMPWEAAQLALLRRVGDGESTFRPDDLQTPEAGRHFDMLVEHLGAMQRRGLVTFPAPLAEPRLRGRQYAAVTDVALTAAGREMLARSG